jgi:phosphoribosylglycinamide formyltransferase-1
LRLHSEGFVASWRNRHLNIHPSLLPAFKGLHAHARVLAEGVKITGTTVHFVRPEMDSGPIVAQAAVPVLPGDSAGSLAARVLVAEHRLYPLALGLVASGAVRVEGELVVGMTQIKDQAPYFSPPPGARDWPNSRQFASADQAKWPISSGMAAGRGEQAGAPRDQSREARGKA